MFNKCKWAPREFSIPRFTTLNQIFGFDLSKQYIFHSESFLSSNYILEKFSPK